MTSLATDMDSVTLVEQSELERSASSSETSDPLNTRDDEGWEDVEPDVEPLSYASLFDGKVFLDIKSMVHYDRSMWDFDLVKIQKDLDLDFLESIKLVNYIRSQVKQGNRSLILSSKDVFSSDDYLKPVLEDDAVLFSLDDIFETSTDKSDIPPSGDDLVDTPVSASRVAELERQLHEAHQTIKAMREFSDRLIESKIEGITSNKNATDQTNEIDASYFSSYGETAIHQAMLGDTTRTDAYRDFIYDNKNLFNDKLVLDVGCGTGILSMMCAKAGAKQVYAVDASDIINKARENVFANKLQDSITCLHGKIEEIQLPVDKVDIIVSEWMGYALLYEAMLDSVLLARDKWLTEDGIMAPWHVSLYVSPVSDDSLVENNVSFWNDVYGFDMRSMQEGAFDEPHIQDVKASALIGSAIEEGIDSDSRRFLSLDLYKATLADLTFSNRAFHTNITRNVGSLDAFVIWFDADFGNSPEQNRVTLSTAPTKAATHWQQVVLQIDNLHSRTVPLEQSNWMTGSVGFERVGKNLRSLNITVRWEVYKRKLSRDAKTDEGDVLVDEGRQTWKLL